MKIAVDAMGGDFAPQVIVEGTVLAAKEYGIKVVLVGDEDQVSKELSRTPRRSFLSTSTMLRS